MYNDFYFKELQEEIGGGFFADFSLKKVSKKEFKILLLSQSFYRDSYHFLTSPLFKEVVQEDVSKKIKQMLLTLSH